ncbi:hypothetical protein CYY_008645 [Polysphondylium violaceum]|uniref:SMP-LTD domain-containing protein n=1 Tax=Polysphondylium violaceum TaxID=133409 RepID=A0A8J4V132_9MYCE|nr:hypothetical protein CYY_008645 [Polysphondylium violaceum]
MSFKLSWGNFDNNFIENLKNTLTDTLNNGPPIPNITDKLSVYNLVLGDLAPQVELLEIDPSKDKLTFVFKFKYQGNALLELRTNVQANPVYLGSSLNIKSKREKNMLKNLRLGPASKPHVIPLSIVIKDIDFEGVLSVSIVNAKIEASFKEDPLKSINIVTSFDEFPPAAAFIKSLVEGQLRDFIMKEFPTIVGSITIPLPASPDSSPVYSSTQTTPSFTPPSSLTQQTENSISINNSPNLHSSNKVSTMLPFPSTSNANNFSLIDEMDK